jgi:hypothetical protein
MHSNASWLAVESCRPLFWDAGPGTLSSKVTGYLSTDDGIAPQDTIDDSDYRNIGWSTLVSRHYGPFVTVTDRSSTAFNAYSPRAVVVEVDVSIATASSIRFYACLMSGTSNPYSTVPIVFSSPTRSASTGRQTIRMLLGPDRQAEYTQETCRPPSQSYATSPSWPQTVSVHVGWNWDSGSAPAVIGISGFECRL